MTDWRTDPEVVAARDKLVAKNEFRDAVEANARVLEGKAEQAVLRVLPCYRVWYGHKREGEWCTDDPCPSCKARAEGATG